VSKACTKCGKEKPLDKFDFKHRVAKNGTHHFYGMCRKCRNAKIMEWHKKNPKKVTLAQQKYAENNREKLIGLLQDSREVISDLLKYISDKE